MSEARDYAVVAYAREPGGPRDTEETYQMTRIGNLAVEAIIKAASLTTMGEEVCIIGIGPAKGCPPGISAYYASVSKGTGDNVRNGVVEAYRTFRASIMDLGLVKKSGIILPELGFAPDDVIRKSPGNKDDEY